MKARGLAVMAVAACAIGWFGRSAYSEDAPAQPDQAEMMAHMTPGEEHARLVKAFVGEWDVKSKFAMGAETMEGTAVSKYESILGGRYVRQDVKGTTAMGPFEAASLMGYNNGTKQYVSAWVDNMGTGIMTGTGVENEKGKSWSFTSKYDFGKGKTMTSKEEYRFKNDDEFTIAMDMGEFGKGEVTCKRKK